MLNGYGNTIYRCECGFEAWGVAKTYHEFVNPTHLGMEAIGYHRFDPRTNTWEFRPMVNKSELVTR